MKCYSIELKQLKAHIVDLYGMLDKTEKDYFFVNNIKGRYLSIYDLVDSLDKNRAERYINKLNNILTL